jgi:TfoX/Sxy family transcriptional regulator of competence genes
MAYNQKLVDRIEAALDIFPEHFTQKKMFGGIAFLYQGKMTVGAINHDLMVRVVSNKMEKVLRMENVRPMDFTGTPMKEFIFVAKKGYQTEEQLQHWIELGFEHAKTKLLE